MAKTYQTASILIGGGLGFAAYEALTGHEKFYKKVLMPTMQMILSPEAAHNFSVKILSFGIVPFSFSKCQDPVLKQKLWNLDFENPVGMAAGFDKHAEAILGLSKLGFGFVEVGSVTPLPQDGNQQPRVFRLPKDKAVINRYGFNSCGHDVVEQRLHNYKQNPAKGLVLGVNLGKNKTSEKPNDDYVAGVRSLGPYADYIVINVSSPNTPGLRDLQGKEHLSNLCLSVIEERDSLPQKPPVLVKVAPDLNDDDKKDIAEVLLDRNIDGLIVSNTTISRSPTLTDENKHETGGLSGCPVKKMSTELVRDFYQLTKGSIPIVGVGGIENGVDAYEKIKNGASLVQIYTSFTYQGPPIVNAIKKELADLLKKDGFSNIANAVGVENKIEETSCLNTATTAVDQASVEE